VSTGVDGVRIWPIASGAPCARTTAVVLILSPWGQRSGAHFNPATTLTFWRLGKVATADAAFFDGVTAAGSPPA